MPCIVHILLCCYLYVGTEVILFPQRFLLSVYYPLVRLYDARCSFAPASVCGSFSWCRLSFLVLLPFIWYGVALTYFSEVNLRQLYF